jgi:hypothetical protein
MTAILHQMSTIVPATGLVAIAVGILIALSIYLTATIAQPDFWKSRLYFFRRRLQFQIRVLNLALQKENTTRSGIVADWFFRAGTVLLFVGGIAKAVMFFIERPTP